MDPNATLKLISEAIADMMKAGDLDLESPAQALASAVYDLDKWLARGGFLPDAWESSATPADDNMTVAQERAIHRLYARTESAADFAVFRAKFSHYEALGCAGGFVGGIFYGIESDGHTHT